MSLLTKGTTDLVHLGSKTFTTSRARRNLLRKREKERSQSMNDRENDTVTRMEVMRERERKLYETRFLFRMDRTMLK